MREAASVYGYVLAAPVALVALGLLLYGGAVFPHWIGILWHEDHHS